MASMHWGHQCNTFCQQETLKVVPCMVGIGNMQGMQSNIAMQNMPMASMAHMVNPIPCSFTFGPFCSVAEVLQCGFQGAKVYAVPADQMQQMGCGWGFNPMITPQEITVPKGDWSPNGSNGFGYHASWVPEPEMHQAFKEDWSPDGSNGFGDHASWVKPKSPEAFKDFVETALDRHACWDLQNLIPRCSNAERILMANQLRGHVREVVESPHGNHVLQRMLEYMAPETLSFVLDEMLAWAPAPVLARHRFGCRVLERILEHFHETAIKGLLDDLLCDAKELCLHHFGNFVMQTFLEQASDTYRKALSEIIARNLVQVASDYNGCAVLEKCLAYAEEAERKMLVKLILEVEGLLPSMKTLSGGATAIGRVLHIATEWEWALAQAQRQLSGAAKKINKGRRRWRRRQ